MKDEIIQETKKPDAIKKKEEERRRFFRFSSSQVCYDLFQYNYEVAIGLTTSGVSVGVSVGGTCVYVGVEVGVYVGGTAVVGTAVVGTLVGPMTSI